MLQIGKVSLQKYRQNYSTTRSYCSVRLIEEKKASVHNFSFLDINHFLSERFSYDFRSMFSRASLVPLSQKSFTSFTIDVLPCEVFVWSSKSDTIYSPTSSRPCKLQSFLVASPQGLKKEMAR